jgi:hypothetical protein
LRKISRRGYEGALPMGCLPLNGREWVTLTDGTGLNGITKKKDSDRTPKRTVGGGNMDKIAL